ncbi:MAG TPA: SH3 domain-containing protein [Candidatus Ozemobacteraceae bacterium]|nr:SH3 domain-containing protein [Candidatus Ozemobacteraceae bacterium]
MKRFGTSLPRLLLFCLFLTVFAPAGFAARRYVIPTWYGYGTYTAAAPFIHPYIVSPTIPPSMHPAYLPPHLPSQDPIYYSSWRSWNPTGTTLPGYFFTSPAGRLEPYWDGSTWLYRPSRPSGNAGQALVDLNLRSDPGFGSRRNRDRNVIGTIRRGEAVSVLGRTGDWYYIQSSDGHSVGYVYARHVRLQADLFAPPSPVWTTSEPLYHYSTAWPQPLQPVPVPGR